MTTVENERCAVERKPVDMPMPRQPVRLDWSPVPLLKYDGYLDGFSVFCPWPEPGI
jgi:hypothetical protein